MSEPSEDKIQEYLQMWKKSSKLQYVLYVLTTGWSLRWASRRMPSNRTAAPCRGQTPGCACLLPFSLLCIAVAGVVWCGVCRVQGFFFPLGVVVLH